MTTQTWPDEYVHPLMQEFHEFITDYTAKVRDGELTIDAAALEASESEFGRLYDLQPGWIEHHISCYLERPLPEAACSP